MSARPLVLDITTVFGLILYGMWDTCPSSHVLGTAHGRFIPCGPVRGWFVRMRPNVTAACDMSLYAKAFVLAWVLWAMSST